MNPAASTVVPSPGGRGRLLRALMAAVRPQLRVDVWIPAADDPVFGGGACLVEDRSRPARPRAVSGASAALGRSGP